MKEESACGENERAAFVGDEDYNFPFPCKAILFYLSIKVQYVVY